jgi:rhodanese-related sulfurtransferase
MSRRSSASPDKPSTGRSRSSARRSGQGGAPVRRLWAMVIATLLISAGTLLWLSSRGTDAPAGGPSAAGTRTAGGAPAVREIGHQEVDALKSAGVKVVDIREAWEWEETGVIEGSLLLTAFDASGRLNPGFAARFQSLVGPEEEVVLVCRSGSRSGILAGMLAQQMGYSRVRSVTGGIASWLQSSLPVVACSAPDGVSLCQAAGD